MASEGSETKKENPLYKGSCHCGFFAYEARINLQDPKKEYSGAIITKCNCSICHKTGAPLVAPDDGTLKITSPPKGYDEVSEYNFNSGRVHHYFCPKCGIKVTIEGVFNKGGEDFRFKRINVLTIDERVDGQPVEELKSLKTGYFAGKKDEWHKPIAAEPYEGGAW